MKIILIDNYDSFTFNLYHYLSSLKNDVHVVRNDKITSKEILELKPHGIFLSIGIAFNLVLYAFVNAAVVTGIFPVTGLPMPMVSYGGSGMVINMAMMGILLNISQSRQTIHGSTLWKSNIFL